MKRLLFVSAALCVVLVYSCKKLDTTEIGGDLIPAVDNVNTFDTVLDVISDNLLLDDSARILNSEDHALGIIANDPEFGKTNATIYFSLTPFGYGTHPFAKKDSVLIFDSVILALDYRSTYGDSLLSKQQVDIHEIDFDANFQNNIFGFRADTADVPYSLTVLGSKMIDFGKLRDSVFDIRKRDTLKLKNQLRIPLNLGLANRFVSYDTSNAYKNDSTFRTLFRGFALKINEGASPLKNALAYFSLNSSNTKLYFYYRVKNGSVITDTLVTEFGFYSFNTANINTIRRTNSNNYLAYLNNGNPDDNLVYLQSSPGSYATIKIPGLKGLSNRIIHRAELIAEVVSTIDENIYTKPGYVFVDAMDTAKSRIITVPYDFSYENNYQVLFGGLLNNNVYNFNISRYVQGIVTRKEKDYTLRISAPYRSNATETTSSRGELTPANPAALTGISLNKPIAKGRVVLAGGSYANRAKRMRVRIIYSKI